jgi:hypothetical protein
VVLKAAELTFDRCLARLFALERNIKHYQEHYEDRDDLAGVQILLEALGTAIRDAQLRVIAEQRQLNRETDSDAKRAAGIVQSMTLALERSVGNGLEAVSREPSRDFEQLIGPIARLVRKLEPDVEIIFRPSGVVRYSLGKPILTALVRNLEGRSNPLAERIANMPTLVELRYPAAEEGNVLQHLVLMHELAHLRLRRPDDGRAPLGDLLHEMGFDPWRRATLREAGRDPAESGDGTFGTKLAEEIAQTLKLTSNWFTELACDLLALRLAGPAYLLALREHAALRPWFYSEGSAPQRSHPHLAWRLSLISEEVGAFLPVQDGSERRAEMWEVLRDFQSGIPDWKSEVDPAHVAIVSAALDELKARADDILGDSAFSVERLDRDLHIVWDKLEAGIPPSEALHCRTGSEGGSTSWRKGQAWSEPIDWRSVINIAYFKWYADLRRDEPDAAGSDSLKQWTDRWTRREELNAHLRGSLELTDLLTLAQGLKGELSTFSLESADALG